MKLTLKKIIKAYDALKDAHISTLETAEQGKIFKVNRAIYSHFTRYEAERTQIVEKLKPQDFDQMAEVESKVNAGVAEKEEILRYVAATTPYKMSLEKHLDALLKEEHELNVEPIDEAIWKKVMAENKWTFAQFNAVDVFVKEE